MLTKSIFLLLAAVPVVCLADSDILSYDEATRTFRNVTDEMIAVKNRQETYHTGMSPVATSYVMRVNHGAGPADWSTVTVTPDPEPPRQVTVEDAERAVRTVHFRIFGANCFMPEGTPEGKKWGIQGAGRIRGMHGEDLYFAGVVTNGSGLTQVYVIATNTVLHPILARVDFMGTGSFENGYYVPPKGLLQKIDPSYADYTLVRFRDSGEVRAIQIDGPEVFSYNDDTDEARDENRRRWGLLLECSGERNTASSSTWKALLDRVRGFFN